MASAVLQVAPRLPREMGWFLQLHALPFWTMLASGDGCLGTTGMLVSRTNLSLRVDNMYSTFKP